MIIENIGAISYCLASFLFFSLYLRSTGSGNEIGSFRTRKNIFYLGLSLLFFVAFGEEISWGQTIFGWETPEAFREINAQGETNLHNIPIFEKALSAKQKFKFLLITYFLIIPLVDLFPKARKLFTKVGLPIPPLWISLLFTIQSFILDDWSRDYLDGYPRLALITLKELEECNWGVITLMVAGAQWLKIKPLDQRQNIKKKLERRR